MDRRIERPKGIAVMPAGLQAVGRAIRVAMVTNIPAPYRLPVYERLAAMPDIALKLFFCSGREPDRAWDLAPLRVPHVFLRGRMVTWSGRHIHANPDTWQRLGEFGPRVVVTTGFNPTHLIAFAHARAHGARHVAMTDGTAMSEAGLTALHRWTRRQVYRRSDAFVGAGAGSFALYRQYGVPGNAVFRSALCADNPRFLAGRRSPRDVDLIFCGRFAPGKQPLFAIDAARAVACRLGRRVTLLLVGAGELEGEMRRRLAAMPDRVDARFAGFARQAELPSHYGRARVLLFPTLGDTWGVVANEACAAGVPVIVSPMAGVAGDLVRDGVNGRVLPLQVDAWADAAARMISDEASWQRLSEGAVEAVRDCSFENAARGLALAVRHAIGRGVR